MLIELHYLPNIEYFSEIVRAGEISLETQETYQKQTYRNRTQVLGANKVETLTIPILHGDKSRMITEVEIDHSTRWTSIHLQTLKSAYGRSPYFEYYFPLFERIYLQKPLLLFDFNYELLSICLEILGLKIPIHRTQDYQPQSFNSTTDRRNTISPKKPIQNMEIIAGITYIQTFGNIFVKNLSVIDIIFNEGKNAKQILQKNINI